MQMPDIISFHPYFCISFNMSFLKYKIIMPLSYPTIIFLSDTESIKFHDCLKKKMSLHSCFCLNHDPVRIHTLLCLRSLNHLMHLFFHHSISLLMKLGHLSLENFPHSVFHQSGGICFFSPHLSCKLINNEGKYFIEFLLKIKMLKYILLLLQLLMK